MNPQENVRSDIKESPIEDLTVNAVDAGQVKGGAAIYRNINGVWTMISADVALGSSGNEHGTHVGGTIASTGN